MKPIACLLIVFSVMISGCAWGGNSDRTSETTTTTIPQLFDFSDVMSPGLDSTTTPPLIIVPECLPGVTRVALISGDFEDTLWEVVALNGNEGMDLEEVSIGSEPNGFRTRVALADSSRYIGIVVVSSATEVSLLAVVGSSGHYTPPRGCPA
jgi:hypothetical protein